MGFHTGKHGKVYNDATKSKGHHGESPDVNDGSHMLSREHFPTGDDHGDGVKHDHYVKNNVYPKDLTDEEFDDTFSYDDILMWVDKYEDQMDVAPDEEHKHKVIEHGIKREEFAVDYAKKHDAVIYTQVDREDGEIGYEKGYHMLNAIDGGYYVIVRKGNH